MDINFRGTNKDYNINRHYIKSHCIDQVLLILETVRDKHDCLRLTKFFWYSKLFVINMTLLYIFHFNMHRWPCSPFLNNNATNHVDKHGYDSIHVGLTNPYTPCCVKKIYRRSFVHRDTSLRNELPKEYNKTYSLNCANLVFTLKPSNLVQV